MGKKIYVGNLNYTSTKEQLQEHFAQFGGISEVALPEDKFTGKPRGFAFITFNSPADAQKACDLANGQEFSGRTLKVNLAQERERTGGGSGGRSDSRGGFGGGRGGDRDRDSDSRW